MLPTEPQGRPLALGPESGQHSHAADAAARPLKSQGMPEFLTSEEAGGGHPSDTGRWGASQKLVFQGTEHAIRNQPFEACPGCLEL